MGVKEPHAQMMIAVVDRYTNACQMIPILTVQELVPETLILRMTTFKQLACTEDHWCALLVTDADHGNRYDL